MLNRRRDTIVAPATPPGEGGVAVIRISGGNAEALLRRFFRPSAPLDIFASHRLYHGAIHDRAGLALDEVLAVIMHAPRSFTREDVAEIHCHGGPTLVARILDLLVDGGARLAQPGEFTFRAFLNGRIDLTRAEAVIDLIRSRSPAAGNLAFRQLSGELSRAVFQLRDALLHTLAEVEAWIDFPEEDLPLPSLDKFRDQVLQVTVQIDALLAGFATGRALREGLSLLILGSPNVGKSSLLNVLLGESRAIVTDIPGTTRDTIEEPLVLGGVPLRVVDTAGIRDCIDPVEAEGVRRTLGKVTGADLILLVVDGSRPVGDSDLQALELCSGRPTLVVANKADLGTQPFPDPWCELPRVAISTHTGFGIDNLRVQILQTVQGRDTGGGDIGESVLVSDRRHREALVHCRGALELFLEGIKAGRDFEFLALEVREALAALGEITGETTPEQVLDLIFSRFCIGK
jgi:tRNA modification GTPase